MADRDTSGPEDSLGAERAAHDRLAVHTFRHGGRLVIEALGVISMATLSVLDAALQASAQDGDLLVTIDLRRVDFLDSSGLALLVTCSGRLRTPTLPRAPRVLVLPGRQPERVLLLGGFGTILEIAYDLGTPGPP